MEKLNALVKLLDYLKYIIENDAELKNDGDLSEVLKTADMTIKEYVNVNTDIDDATLNATEEMLSAFLLGSPYSNYEKSVNIVKDIYNKFSDDKNVLEILNKIVKFYNQYNDTKIDIEDITKEEIKHKIVTDTKGNKVIMSCPEAPEILFMDFGHAQLKDGKAYIKIDPILSKNILVDEQHPLKVFIQLEGECNGVYVTNKSKDGFEVVELNNGKSNVPFTWQIVAQRADEYDENGNLISKNVNRFPPAMLPMPTTSKPTKKLEINPEEFKQNIKKNEIVPPLERK